MDRQGWSDAPQLALSTPSLATKCVCSSAKADVIWPRAIVVTARIARQRIDFLNFICALPICIGARSAGLSYRVLQGRVISVEITGIYARPPGPACGFPLFLPRKVRLGAA